ncbi:MAG: TrkA family potassium uptake protein [Desulfobacteraceae bacterium]|nr:TrkA family potassium uptake protein [Desulfobacteraceae bacterium]
MKVLIVGSGKTVYFLCKSFTAKGYEVVIINRDHQECVQLARQVSATVVCGDGSNADTLEDAGAMYADAILAITPNDQDNLIICQLAAIQFGVPRAVALANDPENAEVFQELGISAFSTTHIIGNLIEQRASLEQVINLLPVGEGRVNVTEVHLDEASPVAGSSLSEITLPQSALVAVVIRENQPIVPRGDNRLLKGDRVVIITLPENHEQVLKIFTGNRK